MDYKSVFKKFDEDKLRNEVYELTYKLDALCDYLGVEIKHVDEWKVFKKGDKC